jgi:hypothetical protein
MNDGWIVTLPEGNGQVWARFEGDVFKADYRAESWHSWTPIDQRMGPGYGSVEVAP